MQQDSSWVIPTLRCTSPADVYLLLKSSDFVSHDLNPQLAFEGCTQSTISGTLSSVDEQPAVPIHELELVLKKWYSMDRGREFRCFVRNEILLGELPTAESVSNILIPYRAENPAISQRDLNYYPHLNEKGTTDKILWSVLEFWAQYIRSKFIGGSDCMSPPCRCWLDYLKCYVQLQIFLTFI